MAERIRVKLRWVQILDRLEPFFKETGEFRFTGRVLHDGEVTEMVFPETGYYEISDHPARNKVPVNKVLFEGEVESELAVELRGVELDTTSADDELDHYRREFSGEPSSWIGRYCPGDEVPGDPENMSNWRICYEIEAA